MNKLYAFLALVFLTACGSPGFEGNWSIVDSSGVTIEIGEIDADVGVSAMSVFEDGEFSEVCTIEKPKEKTSTIYCNSETLIMSLIDGDTLVVTSVVGDQVTFIRDKK